MRWLRKSNGSRNIFQDPELIKISPIGAGSDFLDLSLPCVTSNNVQSHEASVASKDSHSEGEDDDTQRRSFSEFLQIQSGQGAITQLSKIINFYEISWCRGTKARIFMSFQPLVSFFQSVN